MFIGYDGYYYLGSHDWEKVSSHGHVFEQRIVDAIRSRLRHVASRGAPCRTCNFDPVNRVAAALVEAGVEAAQHQADNAQKRWAIVRSSAELNAVLPGRPRDSGARRPSRDHPRRTITRHCAGHLPEPPPERHVIRAAGLTAATRVARSTNCLSPSGPVAGTHHAAPPVRE